MKMCLEMVLAMEFEPLSHFTIGNALHDELGRGRYLSLS